MEFKEEGPAPSAGLWNLIGGKYPLVGEWVKKPRRQQEQ
jgi:hypothetical protein